MNDVSKNEIKKKELIKLIKRQTDYNEEEILEKLKFWNYNYLNVIKEYLNPNFFSIKRVLRDFRTAPVVHSRPHS